MAMSILCTGIFRIVLPLLILASVVFRPSFLSVIYLIFFLFLPWVPSPTAVTLQGITGIYLKIMIAVTVVTALGQFAFQIVLVSLPPYGNFLENCNFMEKMLRHAGFVRLDANVPLETAFRWTTPEFVMLLASIGTLIFAKKLTATASAVEEGEGTNFVDKMEKKRAAFLTNIGRYPVMASVCIAGILRPSALNGLYFIVYLGIGTWWACSKSIGRKLGLVFRALSVPLIAHLVAFYAVQFEYVQEFMEPHAKFERYFGLTPLILTNCTTDPRVAVWSDVEYASFLNPFALLWLYYGLVLISKELCKEKLLRGVSPSGKSGASTRRQHHHHANILQDSTGSVTVTDNNQEEIQMKHLEEDEKPTVFEKALFVLETLVQVIIRSSYIVANITMMAWSITYHSWLTFVLLLWANLLWMLPNQRKSMLRSAPLLVIYAWFLLVSAYIYSMDLTDEELPSVVQNINLAQIGFQKVTHLPYLQLLVKCLYTMMFWITLRQYVQERREARQSSALADMVAPLQVTVGTATGVSRDVEEDVDGNQSLKRIGQIVYKILTKFWIWVVAITLYAVAITGTRMTAFRIVYMTLFLFFVLCFQLSFRIWRRIMFAFWVVIIAFSMLILILVYTYQFDNFREYWKEYLHISIVQQGDIGLEHYETKQLFVRLVTPTFFVIITAVQLHYFHKDFMEMSDPTNVQSNNNASGDDVQSNGSSAQGLAAPSDDDSAKLDLTRISSVQLKRTFREWMKEAYVVLNYVILFLELHMPKIVLMVAACLCVYDKCALFFVIAVLVVLAFTIGKRMIPIAIHASSIFVSLVLLARMVYQIEYIKHDMWNVTCENDNTTYNSAEWLGFTKIAPNARMSSLVMWNVFYIIIVTLWAVINVRQAYYRSSQGHVAARQYFIFPKVKRSDADKNLRTFCKYLLNYGFYKFGVEICLNATVALIGFRLDLYAFLHAIWLCALFSLRRRTLARVWNFYLTFVAVLIPIQYVMVVGLPPALCVDFPWKDSEMLRRLQEWAYIMDPIYGPSPKKLLCDFVLLLFVSRQSVVFRIEKRHEGQEYPGGSNDIIVEDVEKIDYVNPTPDFVTYCRSYLDVFKRGVLLGFLWFTLAIVFLAGTNRVNLFSIGYLIGSFVFLWQGTDFYLRPIPKILQMWNWLLGYNVMVIMTKTVLQFVGCVYIAEIQSYACWLVQLLGIGCIKKFGNVALRAGIVDPNECTVPREYIGLAWDGVCFGFLLLQRRIFTSYNFLHMVDDCKASAILASRGAELIEELRQKRTKEQEENEKKVLEKIKVKMDRIKATQQKLNTKATADPQSHSEAIRSGDYYMFDELDDDDLDIIEEPKRDYLDEAEEEAEIKSLNRSQTMTKVSVEKRPRRKIAIRDVKEEEEEPQPGTSRDDELSDLTAKDEPVSVGQRVVTALLFVWAFVESFMISVTLHLNSYSKDYRYVRRVLTKEKKLLKETTEYKNGHRQGRGNIWQPASSYHTLIQKPSESKMTDTYKYEYDTDEMSSVDQPAVVRLLLALWYIVLNHSDFVCYFIIFLNQIKSATFLSLPLPLMVFLWGSLTVPRPTKTFWVTIIAYTEVIVIVKCIFQFEIIPWNQSQNIHPFYPPKIIGIERKKDYAIWDLILLLIVFFHRYMLKSLGLWKTVVDQQVLTDGKYVMHEGKLEPIETADEGKPTRRHSDLQQLVEDVDENEEDSEGNERVVQVRLSTVSPVDMYPSTLGMTTAKYLDSTKKFFRQLIDPTSRVATDVYSYMFLCDFFNFFVILIGYSSFGTQQGDEGVSAYLEDNRVPVLFLLMLILQFMLIIIDRGIFLRKYIVGKVIFQFTQIFILHVWLFVLFPLITERSFNSVLPPQMYYMVKCFYLLLSAYQIRCGYPTRILGNFLCKGYNYVNMFLFKGFMAVPFLFELRTVMDWMWTDTSMTIFDWIKMEDIFAHIFQLKCQRYVEKEYPAARGMKRPSMVKYMMGGGVLAVIIGIIWFPLVFFSLSNAVGQPNVPYDVSIDVRIGPYEPIYQMSAQANSIYSFTDSDYNQLLSLYDKNKVAISFISNYEAPDIAAVRLSSDSGSIWSISPPDKKRMLEEVNSTKPITVKLEYRVSHKSTNKQSGPVIIEQVDIVVDALIDNKPNPVRKGILDFLDGRTDVEPVTLNYLMPKFLKVTNRNTAPAIHQLMEPRPTEKDSSYRNVSIKLSQSDAAPDATRSEWWEISEICDDFNYKYYLRDIPYSNCDYLMLYTFNDKMFPETFSIITAGGIIGLYTTMVFIASRFLRGFFSEICFKIMFDDMPYVDRILQLCYDIYLVRESSEFALEEDLFAKLVFLFRSPETLIKWTRPKEEVEDEDDPEGEADT